MARLSTKSDSSFFKKIASGAVGVRAVAGDLDARGHDMRELENGSTDSKLWKEVKRKRVRIPDLVCVKCGVRLESKAKRTPELALSHSATDAERAWYAGLVPFDIIAFPVYVAVREENWGIGRMKDGYSYWHQRDRVQWATAEQITYVRVEDLKIVPFVEKPMKGAEEGAERSIYWQAIFAKKAAKVVDVRTTSLSLDVEGKKSARQIGVMTPVVVLGEEVREHQLLAAVVPQVGVADLACPQKLSAAAISALLDSPQLTERFTGIKLLRLRGDSSGEARVAKIPSQAAEDIYVKLEAAVYLSKVCGQPVGELFKPFLSDAERETRLEAVITLAEVGNAEAVELLASFLNDKEAASYLRSAAAWGLGRIGSSEAIDGLVNAFSHIDVVVREEALEALSALKDAVPSLVSHLRDQADIAAGCAEALRRLAPAGAVDLLFQQLASDGDPTWVVWLIGHLPPDYVATKVAELEDTRPEVHFATAILRSFVQSWIARCWELNPTAATFVTAEK